MKKTIIMTGASGFIGTALRAKLQSEQFRVISLTRDSSSESPDTLYWNPKQNLIPSLDIEGLEGIIHLAGENIAASRWSAKKKYEICFSRCHSSWLLTQACLKLKLIPGFFFSASAVGYYGSCGDQILTESTPQGKGFLAHVCGKWERSCEALKEKGIRLIYGRFGNVLDPAGGILKKLIPLFQWGLGAQLGNGLQWISWISREDLVEAINWTLFSTALEGPVNFASPHPVIQKEWALAIAKATSRPFIWKVPKLLIRLIFKEMGDELLLSSLRVKPEKLLQSSFEFKYSNLPLYLEKNFRK